MDHNDRRKIMAGGKLRKLRRELGLSQSGMANELGISVSYLNLVERNQRPLTAQLLIRLSESFSVDPTTFAADEEQRSIAEMEEIFANPLFKQTPVTRPDIRTLIEEAPGVADAVKRLYKSWLETRELHSQQFPPAVLNARNGDPQKPGLGSDPVEDVRAFLERHHNYFEKLERRAEQIRETMNWEQGRTFGTLVSRLQERHGLRVQIVPVHDMQTLIRHHDQHRRKLMLSELLSNASRSFQVAYQLAKLEAEDLISELAAEVSTPESAAQHLARNALTNYCAAALLMPYSAFADAAEAVAYDLDVLASRFSVGFEQVAHRLTTLGRASQRRVPLAMVKVDAAGNISKRLSQGVFPFSRYGGTCARWNLHHAFRSPGRIVRQLIEMPDGSRWFSIARTVTARATPWGRFPVEHVIGLICDVRHASKLVYAQGMNLKEEPATAVGINCRLCERPDCAQRAEPPITRKLSFNENSRGLSPFQF